MTKKTSLGNRILLVRGQGGADGIAVRYPLEVSWTDVEDIPFDVTIRLDAGPTQDRLEVRGLDVRARDGGPAVTSAALRALPFGLIRDAAISAASVPIERNAEGDAFISGLPGILRRTAADPSAVRMAATRRTAGPGARLPDEHLARVATIYRQAIANRKPTRAAILKEMGPAGPSTAARWVQEARLRTDPNTGKPFLGAATGTRAGEA